MDHIHGSWTGGCGPFLRDCGDVPTGKKRTARSMKSRHTAWTEKEKEKGRGMSGSMHFPSFVLTEESDFRIMIMA